MIKQQQDLVIALIVIGFGTTGLLFLPRLVPETRSRFTDIGPLFFPMFLLVILILLGVVFLLHSFAPRKPTNSGQELFANETIELTRPEKITQDQGRQWVPVVVYGLMLLYSLVVERFGFVASTIVVMVTLMLIIGERRWLNFVVMILVVLLIRFVFQDLLNVVLP